MNFSKHLEELKENTSDYKINFVESVLAIENDLYNIAKNKIYNVYDIDDILQETIIKIYKNFDTLKDKSAFRSWAIRILLNECNKSLRQKHKETLLYEKIRAKAIFKYDEYNIMDFESDISFRDFLSTISSLEQNIFILHYKCKYSTKEIAKILNINENTIKSKIKRNKAKIKENYIQMEVKYNEENKGNFTK